MYVIRTVLDLIQIDFQSDYIKTVIYTQEGIRLEKKHGGLFEIKGNDTEETSVNNF